MDGGPVKDNMVGPQMGAQLHNSQQTYNGYNNMQQNMQQQQQQHHMHDQNTHNGGWNNNNDQIRPQEGDAMDETDWDYLLSLGIGPSITKDDPSGTALLRHSIANSSYAFDQQMINSEKVRAAKASRKGVIMIPPLMPRSRVTENNLELEIVKVEESPIEDPDVKSDHEGDEKVKKRKKMKSIDPKDMTEEQLVERRYSNAFNSPSLLLMFQSKSCVLLGNF